MKKIRELIKQYDNIVILFVLVVMISALTFNRKLDANDELWCFSNVYKMSNGFGIYKDLNVIITPLFFYIGEIIFQILGANYFIYRIYATGIIYIILFLTIYKLLKILNIQKMNAMLYTMVIAGICLIVLLDPSYNMLAIAMAMMGIIRIIKNKDNSKKTNVIQGIIIFLTFMSKQNIGVFYIAGSIISQILLNRNIKVIIKNIFIQLLTSAILLIAFLVYLQINDNLYGFINYTVLGIGEFANKNISYNISDILILLTELIISIVFIIVSTKEKIPFKKIERENIKVLGTMSICMNFIAFPLCNTAHILIGSVIFCVLLVYILDLLIFRELLVGIKVNKIKKSLMLVIFITFLIISLINNSKYYKEITKDEYYFTKNSPYYGSVATDETIKEIEEICKYIKEQNEKGIEVKVISYYSNLYMNILNKNNGAMDLPFYGNMGKDGENGMIEEIKKLRNTKILILTQDDILYQESKKVTGYIKENLEKEGEINRFSIYMSN